MNFKFWCRVMGLTFSLIVVSSIFLSILDSRGIVSEYTLGYSGVHVIQVAYFILFCIIGFAAFPVFIRLFIVGQQKIGHGELAIIKWLQENEKRVVYIIWIFLFLGLCMALQGALQDDIFR